MMPTATQPPLFFIIRIMFQSSHQTGDTVPLFKSFQTFSGAAE
jgi:hypothetical protein